MRGYAIKDHGQDRGLLQSVTFRIAKATSHASQHTGQRRARSNRVWSACGLRSRFGSCSNGGGSRSDESWSNSDASQRLDEMPGPVSSRRICALGVLRTSRRRDQSGEHRNQGVCGPADVRRARAIRDRDVPRLWRSAENLRFGSPRSHGHGSGYQDVRGMGDRCPRPSG